jgi:CheY-like chemotaxis protein
LSRANPSPAARRLKVLDSTTPGPHQRGRSTAEPADDLVSLGAHELQTAVASMIGCAELIDSENLVDHRLHLYSAILLREVRRLSALVNTAVALQELEHGERELDLAPADVRSLIRRAVVSAGDDDRRPIRMEVPDGLPLVAADAEAILEVLANFLSNARRFSPDGGAIDIAVYRLGDVLEIDVRDHGAGIEPDALPKLFRKFYHDDSGVGSFAPGAGLGLAVNHRIIEAHGGRIVASSKGLGHGALFRFTLPVFRLSSGSAEILIVEDDPAYARLIKAELANRGFSSVRAADAETAEHVLLQLAPRAIILDLGLPGLQGEAFLDRLAAAGARLPTVALTRKNLRPEEVSSLETRGVDAVLPKEAGAPQAAVALIARALGVQPDAG